MREDMMRADEPEFDMHISDLPPFEVAFHDEETQMSSFMNATLQGTLDGKWSFSIATYVDVPNGLETQDQVAAYLRDKLKPLAAQTEGVIFDVQVGKSMEYDTIVEEEAADHDPDEEEL